MDDVNDFFDFSKPFKRETIQAGYVSGRLLPNNECFDDIKKRDDIGSEYAKVYQDAEQQQIFQSGFVPSTSKSAIDDLDDCEIVETRSDVSPPQKIYKKEIDSVYDKYNFAIFKDIDLPIFDSKEKIVRTIAENPVVIIQGDTGCGKTTQVPQFILNDHYKRKEYCNIICTQPRRIAAKSVAKRVCSERSWPEGSLVGHQVALNAVTSDDTRLLYCTTGILLQILITSKDMSKYTHIILDEVHERDQDMDFLLVVIRRLLITNSPNTKIILMSATINAEEFSEYFKIKQGGTLIPAPILNVDTRRLYSVKEFYLCQLQKLNFLPEIINYEEPGISNEMYSLASKLVLICDRLDQQSIGEELPCNYKPSILIFLPGIYEIERMEKDLQRISEISADVKLIILRLHSTITWDEQQRVFRLPPEGRRKVILSTNIAESSITVPDVKYVIDFCLTKNLVTDTSTGLTYLQLTWASKNNCKQRSGRAGRVMNGRVYRLVSKYFYENVMIESGSPEMIRCPLENIVLKAKLLDLGPPLTILALAMTPPNLSDIHNTILTLKEAGALFKTVNGKYDKTDGDLTFIGRVMANLPIDIRITRLIIFGYIFSVLEETIIMAAGLNVKNIFEFPYNNVLGAYSQKITWSDGYGSDLFAILNAYRIWKISKQQNNFENGESERAWAKRYFLNVYALRELNLLIEDITRRLITVGIEEGRGFNRVNWTDKERTIILKIVIAGAFYPNYFVRPSPDANCQKEIFQTLGGRNPCDTVFFTGFDAKYIGPLYTRNIKKLFSKCNIKNMSVTFDGGCEKIFVTFGNKYETESLGAYDLCTAVPGTVRPDVYKAIKLRRNQIMHYLQVMKPQDATLYAESLHLSLMPDGTWQRHTGNTKHPELIVVPDIYTKFIRGHVTHIEHCEKFFFQPLTEKVRLDHITNELNELHSDLVCISNPSELKRHEIVAAMFEDNRVLKYHRARVINIASRRNGIYFKVLFIDYGNFEIIEFTKLRRFGLNISKLKDIPPRVFECRLAEVRPSQISCPNGKWLDEAMEMMQSFVDRGALDVEIYSVVSGIASVTVRYGADSLNQLLVERGHAQCSEETYLSKADHDLRLRKQAILEMSPPPNEINTDYFKNLDTETDFDVEPPPPEKCHIRVVIRGPFSPLESQLYSATRLGVCKRVKVEQQSVNSVLLTSDPQDCHDKLLVAGFVTENQGRSELTARHTSVMPDIPGLPALVTLMFCPTAEMKMDTNKTKYVSVLSGLGCDDKGTSLYEEHDLVMHLDVEITQEDIQKINQIRYSMDSLIYTEPGQNIPHANQQNKNQLTAKIKNLIVNLLETPRKFIEMHRSNKDFLWNQFNEEDVLEMTSVYGDRSIFPAHCGLQFHKESFERMQTLRMHCSELHSHANCDVALKINTCLLCEQPLDNICQLRIHLLSQLHRDRESQIGFTE